MIETKELTCSHYLPLRVEVETVNGLSQVRISTECIHCRSLSIQRAEVARQQFLARLRELEGKDE